MNKYPQNFMRIVNYYAKQGKQVSAMQQLHNSWQNIIICQYVIRCLKKNIFSKMKLNQVPRYEPWKSSLSFDRPPNQPPGRQEGSYRSYTSNNIHRHQLIMAWYLSHCHFKSTIFLTIVKMRRGRTGEDTCYSWNTVILVSFVHGQDRYCSRNGIKWDYLFYDYNKI